MEKVYSVKDAPENKILYGQKVILFDFKPIDLEHFVKLHREDKNGFMHRFCLKAMTQEEAMDYMARMFLMGQIKCWSVYLKQHKEKRCVGYIYITNETSFSANLSGIMDVEIMKGLLKHIRHGTVTYAEDSAKTLIKYLLNDIGYSRIETSVLANNRRSLALNKKCGFIEEGRLRDSFRMDDKFYDVILLSILKKDWKNE